MKLWPFITVVGLLFFACERRPTNPLAASFGGNPGKGKAALEHYGCGGCHTIPGVRRAVALAGPSLAQFASRNYVGGIVDNTPENLIRWIQNPQALSPRTAMPNLRVAEPDARDIASYLYTLR